MKLFTNQKVARYVAAPMIGLSILGGTTLGFTDFANPATGDPGTSQTITGASGFGNGAA
ncbi:MULTISPECIES: hypothetical protein [Mycolicibacterium]|jgi:hypothetical protein|uniref:Uncharacterized protein n=2 Tax=Mycolicibacterium TaxID=1866885 RepID=A0A378TH48_9MYCO|nr:MULTISPECIES: hypothetical protein [Mycolicibacterium]MCV7180816.1 hypothetical protein [Mycolicibacterium murale]BBY85359.1 hypothetical protein MTOK_11410 [Mycolicibacterium tokaiense]GFG57039.1 hypothetical protein MMUR_11750 [Mycolicibacterium murale]STZ60132.1 Uncharacterised protein [Mycolicibacterium tokaiense]